MAEKAPKQKLKLLYLYEIFMKYTDEENQLTIAEIIEKLAEKGISAERKTVYSDIQLLKDFGLDIIMNNSKQYTYCLASREFQLPELKLLADAVASARFLTAKKSNELLNKIESLASIYEGKQIKRQVYVADRVKSMNESIYVNVDTIHRAIQEGKQISFKYFDYNLNKKKHYRDGLRVVSPMALTWNDGRYYLVAFYPKRPDSYTNFRLDRMEGVEVLEDKAAKSLSDFSLSEYMNSTFSMFSGELKDVRLRFHNSLINVVIDRFGKSVTLFPDGDEHFRVSVKVRDTETFYGWLFQFGKKASIQSPSDMKHKYIDMLDEVMHEHI